MSSLLSATQGFHRIFENDIHQARFVFSSNIDDPYHCLGLAICSFLEAALGMESAMMDDASRSLAAAEQLCKKHLNQNLQRTTRFPPGLELEVLVADATVLSGLIHVFSETYVGYMRCIYAMKSAHSKFTKLFKTVFPNGIDAVDESHRVRRSSSDMSSMHSAPPTPRYGLFTMLNGVIGRGGTSTPNPQHMQFEPEGPIEELIVSGTAFGYGIFNLILSILPRKIKLVFGWLGFTYDQRIALQALHVAAKKNDAHSVFAALVLMSYMSMVLQMTRWQADARLVREEYRALIDPIIARFPTGNLWTLFRAKLMRVTHDQDGAIAALMEGTKPDRTHVFKQADIILIYDLAWTLVGERRYVEAAKAFMKMKRLNTWSHATYHFLAAGCYIVIGELDKAQELLDAIPDLIGKKVAGKAPPTEVFIKKKIQFYKDKQRRNGGNEARFVESIKIGLAEELGIFWNNPAQLSFSSAREHIEVFSNLTPSISTTTAPTLPDELSLDLTTPDELAIRSLLLGVFHSTLGEYALARVRLTEAYAQRDNVEVAAWAGGMAMFELAALDLKEMEASELARSADKTVSRVNSGVANGGVDPEAVARELARLQVDDESGARMKEGWARVLAEADRKLDEALELSPQAVDLSSRLDSRIAMVKEEIRKKRDMLGVR
ncbi:hypothetical protein APHAL10511_008557 [Amanita phalloides]|nr:hypothetical protein APHAL10511_008557 [Amanita phalloides]